MIWDFAIGQEVIRIEVVQDGEVIALITELPLSCDREAEDICNAHNREQVT